MEIEDDTPMDIFAGVNVRNRQLLKKQANKKVKSSAQKLCKHDGCETKVHQISQVYCYKHCDRMQSEGSQVRWIAVLQML